MVKCGATTKQISVGFSPLLILFMVKFKANFNANPYSFSPLLILFMVKLAKK